MAFTCILCLVYELFSVCRFQQTSQVTVKTSNEDLAGTDSNVTITLFGSGTSDSGPRLLKESPAGADFNKDKFEKGKTDRFLLPCFDLGIITKIVVEKDEKVDHFTYRAYLIIAVLLSSPC